MSLHFSRLILPESVYSGFFFMPIEKLHNGKQFDAYAWVEDHNCPMKEFLKKLEKDDPHESEKVVSRIAISCDLGPPKNEEQCRRLEGDIFELKTTKVRVLWFYGKSKMLICTHGFIKKQQKTPRNEIDFALRVQRKFNEEQYF